MSYSPPSTYYLHLSNDAKQETRLSWVERGGIERYSRMKNKSEFERRLPTLAWSPSWVSTIIGQLVRVKYWLDTFQRGMKWSDHEDTTILQMKKGKNSLNRDTAMILHQKLHLLWQQKPLTYRTRNPYNYFVCSPRHWFWEDPTVTQQPWRFRPTFSPFSSDERVRESERVFLSLRVEVSDKERVLEGKEGRRSKKKTKMSKNSVRSNVKRQS